MVLIRAFSCSRNDNNKLRHGHEWAHDPEKASIKHKGVFHLQVPGRPSCRTRKKLGEHLPGWEFDRTQQPKMVPRTILEPLAKACPVRCRMRLLANAGL